MTEKYETMLEDKETVINFCEHHIGEWAEVYTTDKVVMRRFEKFCKEHSEYGRLIKEDKYSMTFSVHPKCASLYPYAPRKTNLTDEQKRIIAERLKQGRNKNTE
jgi:predicted DNA binding protein